MNAPITIDHATAMPVAEAEVANPFGWLQRKAPTRYEDRAGLITALQDRSARAHTQVIENAEVELLHNPNIQTKDDANQLLFAINGNAIGLTHWSFGQLAQLAVRELLEIRRAVYKIQKRSFRSIRRHSVARSLRLNCPGQ